ncbi:NADP-dependent oxidoreductase [Paenibacillus sp. GSMTC-2017]|uniref:NADP-dependent oxidoreductase n=1 Tax=Paenibacillus sp. GSMTC-2017 TaxID=2794350 RepID=UPI0018D8A3E9|nr:NADP-dependent oxidoreductase [Paenibacillus sp. GSMTC-2017]MBH5318366.1 NADP-dependent oxidoreductase [Paenibacillus sp. GSMTC-2017]
MKAAAFASIGGPEVMKVMEFPDPQAGPGQVRVKVKTAGVQHYDTGVREGWSPFGVTISLPQILGNEFAGVIDQIGEGVTGFVIGDEVLGFSVVSCYAEYVVVSENQIVIKPETMTWEEAGGLTGNGQGAYIAMKALGVKEGETILIHGAAGSLGAFAVQLAKQWGAKKIIGTASESNHDYLRSLGAIPVTYGEGLVERVRAIAPEGIDAAFDTAGAEAVRASIELVADRKRICTFAAHELIDELGLCVVRGERTAARLAELTELHTKGKLRIVIKKSFPLSQVQLAHQLIETRHGRGKIVLTID